MKIRIGNDIRLNVRYNLGKPSDYANVQSVQAILVNTDMKDKYKSEYKKKNRFIGRFPIEPFVDEFTPSPYNINCSGYYRNKMFVYNEYRGFGTRPNWNKCFPTRQLPNFEYQCEVMRTTDPTTVSIIFPASVQEFLGKYEIILSIKIYTPGFKNNVRTIAANIKDVFELVDDSTIAIDNPVQIEVNGDSDVDLLPDDMDVPKDVYIVTGSYNDDNNKIELNRNDGRVVTVDVGSIGGWYEGD